MTDSSSGPEQERSVSSSYGPDWVALDGPAMRVRRARQHAKELEALEREAAKQREAESQLQALIASRDERPTQPQEAAGWRPAAGSVQPNVPETRARRPTPLISALHIENLRAFAGRHEIPLAPLTLVYGPNSAGKSTLLKGMKTFTDVVNSGRHDALHAWQNAFNESSPRDLITYEAPDPEDPAEVSWRSKLAVGIDFKTRDGSLATAELSYSPNPVGYVDWHSSSIGTLDENELSLKEFGPEDPDPSEPFFAWTFGEHPYARYTVHEKVVGGDWTTDTRVVDPFLFAHSSHRLQQDVFALAYLLRYLGPERGDRSSGYSPLDGPFNIEPRNQGFSDDYRSFGIGDFGRFEVLNQMLAQLEVPYEFEPRLQLTGPSEVLRSQASYRDPRRTWDLKDLRTGAPLHLDQVGYGVSQLLPVIDVCVHAREQVICVEEPELHLHPRLQAKLGNLFATSVLKRGNQVILETHSESILLRVRRLIRSGKLLPAEVAVLYVDNDQVDGTTVSRLRLGDNGELLDPWPTGFFDDSLQDILGITR